MSDRDTTSNEDAAWYESGLSAHGVELDWYNKEAIVRYGRLLVQLEMKMRTRGVLSDKDIDTSLHVLLPAHSHLFNRICNNMPKNTFMRLGDVATYKNARWQVCEFYKEKEAAK